LSIGFRDRALSLEVQALLGQPVVFGLQFAKPFTDPIAVETAAIELDCPFDRHIVGLWYRCPHLFPTGGVIIANVVKYLYQPLDERIMLRTKLLFLGFRQRIDIEVAAKLIKLLPSFSQIARNVIFEHILEYTVSEAFAFRALAFANGLKVRPTKILESFPRRTVDTRLLCRLTRGANHHSMAAISTEDQPGQILRRGSRGVCSFRPLLEFSLYCVPRLQIDERLKQPPTLDPIVSIILSLLFRVVKLWNHTVTREAVELSEMAAIEGGVAKVDRVLQHAFDVMRLEQTAVNRLKP
jgi:hypothetical protein